MSKGKKKKEQEQEFGINQEEEHVNQEEEHVGIVEEYAIETAMYAYLAAISKSLYPLVERILSGDPPSREEIRKELEHIQVGHKSLYEIFSEIEKIKDLAATPIFK